MKRKIRLLCRALLALYLVIQIMPQVAVADGAAGEGFAPRLSDYRQRLVPEGIRPLAGGVPAEYTAGASFAVWENMLAYSDASSDFPLLRVCELRNGEMLPVAEYPENAPIISVVWGEEGLAYLVGERWAEGETELVIVGADGSRLRLPLGTEAWRYTQDISPLARLKDGRLLFVSAEGVLAVCEADGSGMRQVTDAPVQSFVYCDPYVYFTHRGDMATYKDVYCVEYGEYLDVSYPRLYRARLIGEGMERITEGGVRGLSAWGAYVFFQDIDNPFVWPQGEMPEEWLYGVVACINGATGEQISLNIDSARYYPTGHGLAAWLPEFPNGGADRGGTGHEGDAAGFSLILHDSSGMPLCRLDSGSLLWDEANCFAAGGVIWVLEHKYAGAGDYVVLSAIPLDGNRMDAIAIYP